MRIGFTYDLRDEYLAMGYSAEETAELDSLATIEAVSAAIAWHGHAVERIGHVRSLAERLGRGERWDLVFNICEGLRGLGRESAAPAVLEAYGIPYTFSDPAVLAVSLHKGFTKHVARGLGLPTASFGLVEREGDVGRVAAGLRFPLFAKPVAEGTGKGVSAASRCRDVGELRAACAGLLERFRQPVLVEEYLPGRELTVAVVGTGDRARAVGTMEIRFLNRGTADTDMYSYAVKDEWERHCTLHLATDEEAREAERIAVALWRGLGCRDAGRVDFRGDASGRPTILEVNPLAGLNPKNSDLPIIWRMTGGRYEELIGAILSSAGERMGV
ncbi:MAG: D-alanine--D-alanine ligase, partial [Phycisphaerales bacterium]|nr:D-alanine--D-alanine ligase [Phycisphaerales bacterium]